MKRLKVCVSCKEDEATQGSPLYGVCTFCARQIHKVAQHRKINILKKPEPGWPHEHIVSGLKVWFWRGTWRVNRKRD